LLLYAAHGRRLAVVAPFEAQRELGASIGEEFCVHRFTALYSALPVVLGGMSPLPRHDAVAAERGELAGGDGGVPVDVASSRASSPVGDLAYLEIILLGATFDPSSSSRRLLFPLKKFQAKALTRSLFSSAPQTNTLHIRPSAGLGRVRPSLEEGTMV